jgi:hypothetical protein
MVQTITNCWEHIKCGREPGGKNVESEGLCPAAIQEKFNGINRGKNGGRFCWFVKETKCKGNTEINFIDSFEHCQKCEFFLLVQKQETRHLVVVRNDLR